MTTNDWKFTAPNLVRNERMGIAVAFDGNRGVAAFNCPESQWIEEVTALGWEPTTLLARLLREAGEFFLVAKAHQEIAP